MALPKAIDDTVKLNPATDVDGTVYYSADAMDVVKLLGQLFPVFSWTDIKKVNNVFEFYNPFKGLRVKYKVTTYNKHYAVAISSKVTASDDLKLPPSDAFYPSYLYITNSNNDATFPFSVALNSPGGMKHNADYANIQGTTFDVGFNNFITLTETVDRNGNPATRFNMNPSVNGDNTGNFWLYHPTLTITDITAPEDGNRTYEPVTDEPTGAKGVTLKPMPQPERT